MVEKEYIKINSLYNITVNRDTSGKEYTNESIFEFLVNRKSNIVPRGIKSTATFTGGGGGNRNNYNGKTNELPTVSNWIQPMGDFDIAKAVAKAETVTGGSKHVCAKYVRTFLQAGGLNMDDRPGSAYQYAGYLPKKGFKLIATLHTRDSQEQFTQSAAKPGDVAVMAHGEHGHICMYTGKQWVSDFKQKNIWVYSGEGTVVVFRFSKS